MCAKTSSPQPALFTEDSAPPTSLPDTKSGNAITTRDLSRFIRYYCERIRPHAPAQKQGVFRQLQRLLEKGVTLDRIATALQNYEADPFRRQGDPRLSMNIRSFFAEANIKLWQQPVKRSLHTSASVLDALDTARAQCATTVPTEAPSDDSVDISDLF